MLLYSITRRPKSSTNLQQYFGLSTLFLLLVFSQINEATTTAADGQAAADGRDTSPVSSDATSTAVGQYPSHWLLQMLKVLFEDVDWKAITDGTNQVEKVIRGFERVIRLFRLSKQQAAGDRQDPTSSSALDFKRLFSSGAGSSSSSSTSRWWTLGSSSASKKFSSAEAADSSSVKGMLERVACFVGYMRLLNHSNEALAELDAAKVISNLFAADKRNSSGFFGNLFG